MIHVSLLVTPEVLASSLTGPYDVLSFYNRIVRQEVFEVELVGEAAGEVMTASGIPVVARKSIDDIDATDIVYIPSLDLEKGRWSVGRHDRLASWMRARYADGARLCAACTGTLLLAETGLLAGREATIHWIADRLFAELFPEVELKIDQTLVATGPDGRLMMSGASGAWNDLVLYLLTRELGPGAAQAVAKFFLLQWHADGQAAYMRFQEQTMHGDAAIRRAQEVLSEAFREQGALEKAMFGSGLADRTFKRRFTKATGYTPIAYVQNLRIEEAKRRLEGGEESVDEICWAVGYEDPAFFRRLFKRMTGITPSAYRRKFCMPEIYRQDYMSQSEFQRWLCRLAFPDTMLLQ